MNNNNENTLRKDDLPNIIALGGAKGSGKDTCAEYFVSNGYVNCKFAAPLKNMLRSLLNDCGYSPKQIEDMIEGNSKDVEIPDLGNKTARQLMQTLGTEWGRDMVSQDIWTNIMLCQLRNHDNAVITDLRFPNEHASLKEFQAICIEIERPTLREQNDGHISENLSKEIPFDDVIINDGSIEDLHMAVSNCVKFHKQQGSN